MDTGKLTTLCKGKTLPEVWASAEVKAEAKRLRDHFQAIAGQWYDRDGLKHIPIYISLKPKRTLYGKYLYGIGKSGRASIVLYPIRAHQAPPIDRQFSIRDYQGLLDTLCHEYAHHVDPAAGHSRRFQRNQDKIKARLKEVK
jgi:hypothetical protein